MFTYILQQTGSITIALKVGAYFVGWAFPEAMVPILRRPGRVTGAVTALETYTTRGTAQSPWIPQAPTAMDCRDECSVMTSKRVCLLFLNNLNQIHCLSYTPPFTAWVFHSCDWYFELLSCYGLKCFSLKLNNSWDCSRTYYDIIDIFN